MSTNWNPEDEEPEVWKTSPAESSFPSFPFIDRDVPPAELEEYVIPSPPPPPSSILDPVTGQNERPTTPLVGATFAGVGMIFGVAITLAALLGLLWINGWIPHTLGLDGQVGRSASTTQGGSFGKSTGGSHPTGGSGGTTTTRGGSQTPIPSPGTTATVATTPVAMGTATPGPGSTATPSPVPLTVTAIAHDHKSATMTITTRAGTTLTITVTYCDGSTDSKYNNFSTVTSTGTYTDTLTLVKCMGQGAYEGTIAVAAHLNGYQDAMANTRITPGG